MPDFRKKVTIDDVTVEAETDAALLCIIDDEEYWIPKSQIDDTSDVQAMGDKGSTLVVSEWIAEQKGI